jgi:HSP20 family protein
MNNNQIQPASTTCPAPSAHRTGVDEGTGEWSYTPPIDVYESNDSYVIECDAPGMKPDAISLTYDRGVLHLHGQVAPRQPSNTRFLRQEYGVGDFDREIALGRLAEFVDADRLSADYAEGVLTVRLPKMVFAQPRRVEIKVGRTNN